MTKDIIATINRTWSAIAFDIPEDSVDAETMLELCMDADRLTMYGNNPTAAAEAYQLLHTKGWPEFRNIMLAQLPYDEYEAGGAHD